MFSGQHNFGGGKYQISAQAWKKNKETQEDTIRSVYKKRYKWKEKRKSSSKKKTETKKKYSCEFTC